ncbi:MAG: DUF4352 domain-containing protein, partial [Halobacteriaceae archaeon]
TTIPEPASIELAHYSVPEKVEIGEKFSIKVAVTNTGGQPTTFSAPLYMKSPGSSWTKQGQLDFGKVLPGETISVTTNKFTFPYLDRYEIRLGDFSKTGVIQTVSAKLNWGKEYKTPNGYRIRVDVPEIRPNYEYETYTGSIELKSPEDGGQWAFVNIWVKNETGEAAYSPLSAEFALISGNSQYDPKVLTYEPVERGEQFQGGKLQPGIERSGWLVYIVPMDVDEDDVTMAWSQQTVSGDISVNWT